jgi:hypothetical protein
MLPGAEVELIPPALDERPFLKLMVDMDATNLAAANYLWAMGVRGFHDTDPAHRHDNDAMLAIKRAGLFPAMAKLTMLANVNRGPWLGGGFMEQKSEGMAMHLEAMWRDPNEMASHLEGIAFDHGVEPEASELQDLRECTLRAIKKWLDVKNFGHRSGAAACLAFLVFV